MARRFGSTPFADLLANSLAQDDTTLAIAESLDGVLSKSARALPELLIYARLAEAPIDQLLPPMQRLAELAGGLSPIPEPLLDLLAWQFHVDGYEAAGSYEAKLALLQKSLLLHRRKGTAWAVKNALISAFAAPVDLTEWFQYGGKPYFFRVGIDISEIEWTEQSLPDAFRLIDEYKDVRSWLEWLTTRWQKSGYRHIGAIARSDTSARTCLYFAPKKAPACVIYTGAGISGQIFERYTLIQLPAKVTPIAKNLGALATGATSARLRFWQKKPAPVRQPDFHGMAVSAWTKSAICAWRPKAQGRIAAGFAITAWTRILLNPYRRQKDA